MKHVLITGGAGFIGSNATDYFIKKGYNVTILDNFFRKGGLHNVEWLIGKHGKKAFRVVKADVRKDQKILNAEAAKADLILHLAAQVAVTTSVINPREDFDINALGTFNMLEAARASGNNPTFIYSSTNKVYGGLEDVTVVEDMQRYAFKELTHGVDEHRYVDFHSPYGCSKGAADKYVHDYSRIYGMNTIVFRQSCIYGPRQFGVEDQGWVAWFIIALTLNKAITIYGNGKQVRDLLHVHDLVRAYDLAFKNIEVTRGNVYNIGGGHMNAISVWHEFRPILEELFGRKIAASFQKMRPGDQPIFVADVRKAKRDFGWEPQIQVRDGIRQLHQWVTENTAMLESLFLT